MEAEFLVTAWRSPSCRASVRRALGDCIGMAARLVVLSIALGLAGCSDDVQNAANSPPSSSGGSSENPGPTTGSATLTWSPPAENTDGSPLTDLAGYYVHYGTSEASLTETIDLSDADATTYVVSDLSPGTYYFAVSAYNSLGLEGAWSNVASKTL
jgi:Fibronectin type III domain